MPNQCSTCAFYHANTCRINPPIAGSGGDTAWPRVQGTDWCAAWNCWPGTPAYTGMNSGLTIGTVGPPADSGADGNFYIYYTQIVVGPDRYLNRADVFQRQLGNWVGIASLI